jgi:hypothetical protein
LWNIFYNGFRTCSTKEFVVCRTALHKAGFDGLSKRGLRKDSAV